MGIRIIAAFLLSPLMTPFVFILTIASRENLVVALESIPLLLLIYTPFAYVAMVVFGLPAFLLFRALGWSRFPTYIFAGALFGFITMWLIAKFIVDWTIDPTDYIWAAVAGASSGMVFSLILFKASFRCD
jgi:hypothetical protein